MMKNRLIIWSLAAVVFLLVGVAVFQHTSQAVSALLWGWREVLPVNQSIDKSMLGINFGVYDKAQKFAVSLRFRIEHMFVSWLDDNQTLIEETSRYANDRNRWIMITIEPWAREDGANTIETLFDDIRSGAYDNEINRVCSDLASQGRPALIRWGHEMDVVTGRYPWAQHDAEGFAESFRYFVAMCRAIVPDAWYVWSPISEGPEMHRYWPGGEYVDWIGLSIFGFAERDLDIYGRLRSFTEIFDEKYQRVSIYRRKIMVAELGVVGDANYQKHWMLQLFRDLENYPLLKSLVYYDSQDHVGAWEGKYSVPDWRIPYEVLD
jgi:cellulose synthase (UDP-forming)